MTSSTKRTPKALLGSEYHRFLARVTALLDAARRQAARSLNAVLTATYWEMGRRIVEQEQAGRRRAGYGEELLVRLSQDLAKRFGRGFSRQNLQQMRQFYIAYPLERIRQTPSGETAAGPNVIRQAASGRSPAGPPMPQSAGLAKLATAFPLPWSHYARLLQVRNPAARVFYEAEALRGGWSVRQLDRQIESQFYERTALSRNKAAMLRREAESRPQDRRAPEEEIKDPYVLEFLDLRDEYSESDLEDALVKHLEVFLLELGGDFTFVWRQKRLRVGSEWYRVDLVFFHRGLRCLVLIDLKLGRFTHADAGQMHLYLNYAREHWTRPDENPPVGLILCAQKDAAVARYALQGLPNKVMAAEYRTALPDESLIAEELERTRRVLDSSGPPRQLPRKGDT